MYWRQDISTPEIEGLTVLEFVYLKLPIAVDLCFERNPRTAVEETLEIKITPLVLLPNVYKCVDVRNFQ